MWDEITYPFSNFNGSQSKPTENDILINFTHFCWRELENIVYEMSHSPQRGVDMSISFRVKWVNLCIVCYIWITVLWPILLAWINLNPDMDK